MHVSSLPSREEWLRAKEVLAVLPIGKTAFYDGIKRGLYPAPTKFGRCSRWRRHDIQNLLDKGVALGGA
ncbi:helix-turn-helix transcriptional regulator [Pseudoxanthomonas japonensis]|uniref:helix-turn-helix transcriptional regulator n=1 Tax=Pseudoxanthomonas japonensis TaxID=69284 RepID=UPI0037479AB3